MYTLRRKESVTSFWCVTPIFFLVLGRLLLVLGVSPLQPAYHTPKTEAVYSWIYYALPAYKILNASFVAHFLPLVIPPAMTGYDDLGDSRYPTVSSYYFDYGQS